VSHTAATATGLTLALGQFEVVVDQHEVNLATVAGLAGEAAARRADLLLLPELWSSGYSLARSAVHAHATRAEVLPEVERLAREHRLWIAGSVLLSDERGLVRNTMVVIDPSGRRVASYAKVHLFGPMGEDAALAPGDSPVMAALPWCDAGLAVCYDLRFPELFRAYASAGSALTLLSAEWPTSRREHWRTLLRARAIENQCFLAACNSVGGPGEVPFAGHSAIVSPWGEVLAEGGSGEELLSATVDLKDAAAARECLPALRDRRPGAYGAAKRIGVAKPVEAAPGAPSPVWQDAGRLPYHTGQLREPYRSTVELARFIRSRLPDHTGTALDVACGAGANIAYLGQVFPGYRWTGIDIAGGRLFPLARQAAAERGIEVALVEGDFHKLVDVFGEQRFDLVLSIQTLLGIPAYEAALEQLLAVTRGWLVVTSLFTTADIDAKVEVFDHTLPEGCQGPFYYNVYSLERFRRQCAAAGCREFIVHDFEIDVDLPQPPRGMGTYTQLMADGTRLQRSGPLAMPWKFVAVRMGDA
jgi:predicted amidohydrolase/SAM-dependent methyltransferase